MAWRPNKYGANGSEPGSVYLIHFDQPLKHARHYAGFAHSHEQLAARLEAHRKGNGAKLMAAVNAAGITWRIAHIWWDSNKGFERRLKNRGGLARACPICRNEKDLRRQAPAC